MRIETWEENELKKQYLSGYKYAKMRDRNLYVVNLK